MLNSNVNILLFSHGDHIVSTWHYHTISFTIVCNNIIGNKSPNAIRCVEGKIMHSVHSLISNNNHAYLRFWFAIKSLLKKSLFFLLID